MENEYSHLSSQGQALRTGVWPDGPRGQCLEGKIPFSTWDVYQISGHSELHHWKHSPKQPCLLLLVYHACTQLDTTSQEIIPSGRKKYSITSRKKLSTHWLSSCAEHWKVWREINVCYTGIYTFHPDNWLKFQAWGQNWSFIKLIFMIYLVFNYNTFNCFHSQQRLGRRRAPAKNQEQKMSYRVDWSYKYWPQSCKLLASTENQCEWSYNWLP